MRTKGGQPSGLARIENVYFEKGTAEAEKQLRLLFDPDDSAYPYHVSHSGRPSSRTDVSSADRIEYSNYSPPPLWNAPYSLQLVDFENKPKTGYMHHRGEEILIPRKGALTYHFFWTPGMRPPERTILDPAIQEGAILRINPQIPHHTWAVTDHASAWMIFRHPTNSPAALILDDGPLATSRLTSREPLSEEALRKPGSYALIAWGIAELIRDTRQRAGMTTTDLANQVGVDPSSLSRLEEAKANVSLEFLLKICRTLRIGIAEQVSSGNWAFERKKLPTKKHLREEPILCPGGGPNHALHPTYFTLPESEHMLTRLCQGDGLSNFSSWIVLEGRVLFDLSNTIAGPPLILDAGHVVHFRQDGDVQIEAFHTARMLRIVYSPLCRQAKTLAGQS